MDKDELVQSFDPKPSNLASVSRATMNPEGGQDEDGNETENQAGGEVSTRSQKRPTTIQAMGLPNHVVKTHHTTRGFVEVESKAEEAKKEGPSWPKKTFKFLMSGIVEPEGTSAEESYIYQIRSLVMYVFHVVLVFWVVYGTFELEANYHSIIVSDLITKSRFQSNFISRKIKFDEIRVPSEIWSFIREVALKIMYPAEATNGSFIQDNELVGVAQLRQVRVKKDKNCNTAPLFGDLYKTCYGYISEEDAEDTESFGSNSSTPWIYSVNDENQSRGLFHDFSGNGFTLNFSTNYKTTLDQLNYLENNTWIRLGTRAVFLDCSWYCSVTRTFLLVKATFELMPWGSVIPTSQIYSIKALPTWHEAKDFPYLGLDLVLLGYTIGLNFMVIFRLKRTGWGCLFTYANLIDVAIILSTYATYGVHIAMAKITDEKLHFLLGMIQRSGYATYGILETAYNRYLDAAAVMLLCIVLKLIRYALLFNETARLFICSVKHVQGELMCFTIMNLFALFGWGLIYSTVYGRLHATQMTPLKSLLHLIFHHARSFSMYDKSARTLSSPVIVRGAASAATVFYINCISLPTYVALVVHGWQEASSHYALDPLKIKAKEIGYIKGAQILNKVNLRRLSSKLQDYVIAKMNDDYNPFIVILRKYGWTRLESRMLLRKYGINKGDPLTIDQLFEAYQDFWVRNELNLEVTAHDALKKDMEQAERLISYCESTVEDLKHSIEILADKVLDSDSISKILHPTAVESDRSSQGFLGRFWK